MGFAEETRSMIADLVRHFGDGATVTLRRRNTLMNGNTGAPVTALAVNGLTGAGASSIALDAAGLEGTLRAGATFTIAGQATTYTVSADATAASGALTVTFTPVLSAQAANDAVVTIGSAYGDTTLTRMRSNYAFTDEGSLALVAAGARTLAVSADGVSITPEVGDLVVDGTATEYVHRVHTISPSSVVSGWRLIVGQGNANA